MIDNGRPRGMSDKMFIHPCEQRMIVERFSARSLRTKESDPKLGFIGWQLIRPSLNGGNKAFALS